MEYRKIRSICKLGNNKELNIMQWGHYAPSLISANGTKGNRVKGSPYMRKKPDSFSNI